MQLLMSPIPAPAPNSRLARVFARCGKPTCICSHVCTRMHFQALFLLSTSGIQATLAEYAGRQFKPCRECGSLGPFFYYIL